MSDLINFHQLNFIQNNLKNCLAGGQAVLFLPISLFCMSEPDMTGFRTLITPDVHLVGFSFAELFDHAEAGQIDDLTNLSGFDIDSHIRLVNDGF